MFPIAFPEHSVLKIVSEHAETLQYPSINLVLWPTLSYVTAYPWIRRTVSSSLTGGTISTGRNHMSLTCLSSLNSMICNLKWTLKRGEECKFGA